MSSIAHCWRQLFGVRRSKGLTKRANMRWAGYKQHIMREEAIHSTQTLQQHPNSEMAENMLSHALCLHASSDAKVVGGYRAKRSGRSSRSPSLEHVGVNGFVRDFNKRNIQIHLCLLTLSMPIIASNTWGAYVASCVSERWKEFDAHKSRVNWVRSWHK
ncbi:hypothetical protein TNCV_662481 [Trichonephila clavipes]|nr:hypothetical protein TNCV_662481 [Trichonephila clavipes]